MYEKYSERVCIYIYIYIPPMQGVFAPMAEGKMPPAQVVASDHDHVCKRSSCTG